MNFYERRRVSGCLSLISPWFALQSVVFILHFTSSLHFTLSLQAAFYPQSVFYPWYAVCSPQSLFFTDRFPLCSKSTFSSRQINCVFSNTEFKNIGRSSKLKDSLSDSTIPPI